MVCIMQNCIFQKSESAKRPRVWAFFLIVSNSSLFGCSGIVIRGTARQNGSQLEELCFVLFKSSWTYKIKRRIEEVKAKYKTAEQTPRKSERLFDVIRWMSWIVQTVRKEGEVSNEWERREKQSHPVTKAHLVVKIPSKGPLHNSFFLFFCFRIPFLFASCGNTLSK
jgi:hypothetical protein